jgi:hypothetical protein
VLGDVVLLNLGDRVPADLRMLACEGLKVRRRTCMGRRAADALADDDDDNDDNDDDDDDDDDDDVCTASLLMHHHDV